MLFLLFISSLIIRGDCITLRLLQPIWEGLVKVIKNNHDIDFSISSFDKIFGFQDDESQKHIYFYVLNVICINVNSMIRFQILPTL